MKVQDVLNTRVEIEKNKKFHVMFVPTLSSAIAYYRMEQFVTELRKDPEMSVAYTYHNPNFTDTCKWEWNLHNPELLKEFENLAKCADMMIFQAVHSHEAASLLRLIRENYNVKVFTEMDDDPYTVSSEHPDYLAIAPGSKPELFCNDQIKNCDGLVVTTDYLRHVFADKNKNVEVIPNAINFDVWDKLNVKKRNDGLIRIGYSGGANHNTDLEIIEDPIKYILKKHKNVRFVINYGGEIPAWLRTKGVIVKDFRTWKSIKEHPEHLASLGFDIGIAPLRDLRFNRCKSNLKYLEYSALKIPSVVSPVVPYQDTLASFAKTENEWVDKLEELIRDASLRERRGNQSYEFVKRNYSIEKVAKKYNKFIRKVLA